jgi:hypothetical protein
MQQFETYEDQVEYERVLQETLQSTSKKIPDLEFYGKFGKFYSGDDVIREINDELQELGTKTKYDGLANIQEYSGIFLGTGDVVDRHVMAHAAGTWPST